MVGVVTGLAWTEVGGDILYIESVLTPGKGKVSLTGNLGEVMKESATIAHEWVMAHHKELGIDPEMFEKNDINIHVPEGAIPKDGPSAGITMVTSIVSTYTGRKVRERIAMTGETTLRGRVMPVGGIKEKILAAKRAGIKELILSEDNRKDNLGDQGGVHRRSDVPLRADERGCVAFGSRGEEIIRVNLKSGTQCPAFSYFSDLKQIESRVMEFVAIIPARYASTRFPGKRWRCSGESPSSAGCMNR